MLPIGTRQIFRNRWWALAWAVGICWAAVDFAGGAAPDTTGNDAANTADINAALSMLDVR